MTSPTPSGAIMGQLEAMRDLIAALEPWQTMCGVAAEDLGGETAIAAAHGHIHWPELSLDGLSLAAIEAMYPLCLLGMGEDASAERIAEPSTWGDRFTVWAQFRAIPDPAYTDRNDQYVAFGNALGSLEAALRLASGRGTLNVVAYRRATAPRRPAAEEVKKGVVDDYMCEYEYDCEGGVG